MPVAETGLSASPAATHIGAALGGVLLGYVLRLVQTSPVGGAHTHGLRSGHGHQTGGAHALNSPIGVRDPNVGGLPRLAGWPVSRQSAPQGGGTASRRTRAPPPRRAEDGGQEGGRHGCRPHGPQAYARAPHALLQLPPLCWWVVGCHPPPRTPLDLTPGVAAGPVRQQQLANGQGQDRRAVRARGVWRHR